jgi:hypothetical protein
MATYTQSTNENGIVSIYRTDEDGKVWVIPADPANSDYQAYLASLNDTPQG